jgi:RsiW-degrading membrane proteinase PrsW (M82 family)
MLGSTRWLGREAVCPKCGDRAVLAFPEEGRAPVAVQRAAPGAKASPMRWLLLLALLPLAVAPAIDLDIEERWRRTLDDNPKAKKVMERAEEWGGASEEDYEKALSRIPGRRIHGALLARGSGVHWLFLLLSAAAFAAAVRWLVPPGRASWRQLASVGAFTATAGVFLLVGLQAASGEGGILGLLIAVSYAMTSIPNLGFIPRLIGFTCGVGLLEELCKAAPLLWRFRGGAPLDVRGAAAWGLASGLGFGLIEGVIYSEMHYNGFASATLYVIRFVSCVALHGVWTGTVGILMWKRQDGLSGGFGGWAMSVLTVLAGPILLHALYDTLLTFDHPALALGVAVLSFAWFLGLYGRADAIEAGAVNPAGAAIRSETPN